MKRFIPLLYIIFGFPSLLSGQSLLLTAGEGLKAGYYITRHSMMLQLKEEVPLFSVQINDETVFTLGKPVSSVDGIFNIDLGNGLKAEISTVNANKGWHAAVVIRNAGPDTVDIENAVPFGQLDWHPFLTSSGPWSLARSRLFLPGRGPVGVILPDNAWELGYASIQLTDELSICALMRRTSSEGADLRRYRTILHPGGKVRYDLYVDEFQGEWQNGLKLMFRDNLLFDLDKFDNSLFDRPDLQWIRNNYIIGLQFAWNSEFFDWKERSYRFFDLLEEGRRLFGGFDVFGLWPTWPRLGIDQRNQWDHYRDLPGGLDQLLFLSLEAKKRGTRFFIAYNPWDESTREENPLKGMASLIKSTAADGVVLDTRGASSLELQRAADSVRSGVVMYSEGMAVPKDMPGIVSGRVHDAIYLPPPLNLNKLIKPEFAIFRVCQLHDGRIKREASVAFFNGYGTELNTFAPGRPESMEEDLKYLGRTSMILRENTSNYLVHDWTPLWPSEKDSIWVNKWPLGQKVLYTVFSLVPGGFKGDLFSDEFTDGIHFVSLWHHEEIEPDTTDGTIYVPVTVEAFNRYDLGTRVEGNLDCIAVLPEIIKASMAGGYLTVSTGQGERIRVWAGMPGYQNERFVDLNAGSHSIFLPSIFAGYEGKFVIQLFGKDELMDEQVLKAAPGEAILISLKEATPSSSKAPEGMRYIPAGKFIFSANNTDDFIPYPPMAEGKTLSMEAFWMDTYPVTNGQFQDFLEASGYQPDDTNNFLRHWVGGKMPEGKENHPVVYVCLEDARAYAAWAGKRLPAEIEWQYAAQGPDGTKWPWGNEFDSTLCNNASGHTMPVDAHPKGQNKFGIQDLTGNVWQMTNDVYDNGTCCYAILKGGSYFMPTSSWWYVKGGPRPLDWHQQLLLVSPRFDRNATVGFRCIVDAK